MGCWKRRSRVSAESVQGIEGGGAVVPECPPAVSVERVKEIFLRAKERQEEVGGTAGAEWAHLELPAENWGVSRAQLAELAMQLHEMVKGGDLTNPSQMECREQKIPHYDEAKFHDVSIGPNMHQINASYIRPTTQRKDPCHGLPCLSYALHCNSLGLHCDLFISHAWSEGVFELCHTVNQSWTGSCVGAYICSLANPQNLPDLMSHLIQNPSESPFFRVLLARPKEMLMLANSNVAIHSRLWCVYEAHCARRLQISMSVVGDPAHFATNRSASHSVTSAILRAVAARRREMALSDAAEDAAMDMDVIAAGFYHQRFQRWQQRAQRQSARAVKRMKRALDVRKAKCSCPEDGAAVLREIGDGAEQINTMLCELILKDQLQRVPAPAAGSVKLTWYPGQDIIEFISQMFNC